MALDKNVKLCVLLLCVCVMIGFSEGNSRSFRGGDSVHSMSDGSHSFRNPPKAPKKSWVPTPPPQALKPAHNMSKDVFEHDFRARLNGYKIKKTCPDNETCASKCCPLGEGFDLSADHCRAISDEFNPPTEKNNSDKEGYNAPIKFYYVEGFIDCFKKKDKRYVSDFKDRTFYLLSNGTLFMESDRAAGHGNFYEIHKYCIDWFITHDNKTEYDAIICHKPRPFKMHRVLTITCIVMTCVVVLLRVVAMACLPELRTLHGKILLAYLISFFVALLLLVTRMFLTNENVLKREACVGLTFVTYFFTLLAFFWRNVMCYDIWWTFSGIRARSAQGSKTRFFLYCAYAFGWPTMLTAVMAALEFSELSNENVLMPKVKDYGCSGLEGYSKLIYHYGPIMILFVINMVLFTLTALKIAKIKRETKTVLKSKESRTHDQKKDVERFTLYANLFASMLFLEVNWILDSIVILLPNTKNIFIIGDFCNVAVLLFIFFNLLCKKRTWMMIKKRYQHLWRLSPGVTTITSTNRTYSSQTSQTSQISLSQIYTISSEQMKSAATQDDTQTTDFCQGNLSQAEIQVDNQLADFKQDKSSPAESQEYNQSPDSSREKTSPAEIQDDTESHDFIQDKSSPAENQESNQSPVFSREKSTQAKFLGDPKSPDSTRDKSRSAQIQDNTQSPDFSQDNSVPAEIQGDTKSPKFSRQKSKPPENQDDKKSSDFSLENLSPTEIQGDTKSPNFSRENSIPAEIQGDSKSPKFSRQKSKPPENQDDKKTSNFSLENSRPAEIQDDTQSPYFSPMKSSSTDIQDDTQSADFSQENSVPAEIQGDTKFSREKAKPPENQDDKKSSDFSREKSRPAEIQDDTQSPYFSPMKSSSTDIQDDTQSPDFSRENSIPAEIQGDTKSPKFSRQKAKPPENQDDKKSSDFRLENSRPTEIQGDTKSPDFSREKSRPAEIQDDTKSPYFSPKKSNSTDIQDDTQSPDFSREKSRPAEIQDDTQSSDFSQEKSRPAEMQDDTKSPYFSPKKSSSTDIQDNTQLPDFNRLKTITEETGDTRSPKFTVEAKHSMLIAKNTLHQPAAFEKNRTLQRPEMALDHITAVEKKRSLIKSSFRDSSTDDGGGTFQVFKGSR